MSRPQTTQTIQKLPPSLKIKEDELRIREMTSDDINFVAASWLNSYKVESQFAFRIPRPIFFKGHGLVINHILQKPTTQGIVLHFHEYPEIILGYMVLENVKPKPVVHYLYVKGRFRNLGFAKRLLLHTKIDPTDMWFTHWTYPMNEIIKKIPGSVYNPYAL